MGSPCLIQEGRMGCPDKTTPKCQEPTRAGGSRPAHIKGAPARVRKALRGPRGSQAEEDFVRFLETSPSFCFLSGMYGSSSKRRSVPGARLVGAGEEGRRGRRRTPPDERERRPRDTGGCEFRLGSCWKEERVPGPGGDPRKLPGRGHLCGFTPRQGSFEIGGAL